MLRFSLYFLMFEVMGVMSFRSTGEPAEEPPAAGGAGTGEQGAGAGAGKDPKGAEGKEKDAKDEGTEYTVVDVNKDGKLAGTKKTPVKVAKTETKKITLYSDDGKAKYEADFLVDASDKNKICLAKDHKDVEALIKAVREAKDDAAMKTAVNALSGASTAAASSSGCCCGLDLWVWLVIIGGLLAVLVAAYCFCIKKGDDGDEDDLAAQEEYDDEYGDDDE